MYIPKSDKSCNNEEINQSAKEGETQTKLIQRWWNAQLMLQSIETEKIQHTLAFLSARLCNKQKRLIEICRQ